VDHAEHILEGIAGLGRFRAPSSICHRIVSLLAPLLALALMPRPAGAEGPVEPDIRALFHRGSMQGGLVVGYGVGFRAGSEANRRISGELGDVRPVAVIPRFGVGVTDPVGGDAWYRGNLEILLEGTLLFNTEPEFGFAGGIGSTLRYNFLPWRRVVPFVDANFGVLGLDFDLSRQADGFNFNVGAGSGSHWLVGERSTITTEVRWQHISNMNTQRPNDGINDVLFLIGFTHFFR
jgi:hypothetical protein